MIIYGSRYGSAKKYAEKLGEMTGLPCMPFDSVKEIPGDLAVYIGALYAGGVLGLKRTLTIPHSDCLRLIIVTVGIADPEDPENRKNIRKGIEKQIGSSLYSDADIFHLRGELDYSRLSVKHRAMMGLLYRLSRGKREDELSIEDRAFLDTYGKSVDFMDYGKLTGIADCINAHS